MPTGTWAWHPIEGDFRLFVGGVGGGASEGGVETEDDQGDVDGVVAGALAVGGDVVAVPGGGEAAAGEGEAEENFAHGAFAGDDVAGVFELFEGGAEGGD